MIKTQVHCDLCDKPFATKIEETKYGRVETIEGLSRTKVWNTRKQFPHLCECCALKIDNALLEIQNDMLRESKLIARNKKLNDERREQFGTSG